MVKIDPTLAIYRLIYSLFLWIRTDVQVRHSALDRLQRELIGLVVRHASITLGAVSKDYFFCFIRSWECVALEAKYSSPLMANTVFYGPEDPTSLLHLIWLSRAWSAFLRHFCVDFGCYLEGAPATLPVPFLRLWAAFLDVRAVLRDLLDSAPLLRCIRWFRALHFNGYWWSLGDCPRRRLARPSAPFVAFVDKFDRWLLSELIPARSYASSSSVLSRYSFSEVHDIVHRH